MFPCEGVGAWACGRGEGGGLGLGVSVGVMKMSELDRECVCLSTDGLSGSWFGTGSESSLSNLTCLSGGNCVLVERWMGSEEVGAVSLRLMGGV